MQAPQWVGDVLASFAGDDRPAHVYRRDDAAAVTVTRDELRHDVSRRAGALAAHGVRAGDRVAVFAGDPAAFLPTFYAALWLGAVAVPLAPPPPIGRRDAWRSATGTALALVRPRLVCGPGSTLDALGSVTAAILVTALSDGPAHPAPVCLPPDSPAYAQFTSGSTGQARAVLVTRAALTANCAAIGAGISLDERSDVGVCWLPLHHDMGLVGFGCAALTAGVPVVYLPASAFLRDPGLWMRTVSAHRATVTFAPNFAFALATRRARPAEVSALDLSRLRILGCGAEPINVATLERFAAAYAPSGLDPAALTPCYGLAEATLAVTFAGGLRAGTDGTVDCGRPVPGHEVAVVDASGAPCPAGGIGEIWVRGPSVARGYLGRPAPDTFRGDGWLRTGDLGYLVDGSLHVTGRVKDLLVVRGANTDPQRVEWAAAGVRGVREGGAVAFTRPGQETEEVVVVIECAPNAADDVPDAVRAVVAEGLGLAVADVVRVRPGTVPKTTSGKPRRQETRRRYLAGELVT